MKTFKQFNEGRSHGRIIQSGDHSDAEQYAMSKTLQDNKVTLHNHRIEHVPLNRIITNQKNISNHKRAHFTQLVKNKKDLGMPHLIDIGGSYEVLDGNHRIYAHVRNGHTHIKAHVSEVKYNT